MRINLPEKRLQAYNIEKSDNIMSKAVKRRKSRNLSLKGGEGGHI